MLFDLDFSDIWQCLSATLLLFCSETYLEHLLVGVLCCFFHTETSFLFCTWFNWRENNTYFWYFSEDICCWLMEFMFVLT